MVVTVSVGSDNVVQSLRTAYAMGADNAIHIKNDDYEMLDAYAIAESIHKATEGQEQGDPRR